MTTRSIARPRLVVIASNEAAKVPPREPWELPVLYCVEGDRVRLVKYPSRVPRRWAF